MKRKRCKDPICPANQSPPRYLKDHHKNDTNILRTKFNCRFVDIARAKREEKSKKRATVARGRSRTTDCRKYIRQFLRRNSCRSFYNFDCVL